MACVTPALWLDCCCQIISADLRFTFDQCLHVCDLSAFMAEMAFFCVDATSRTGKRSLIAGTLDKPVVVSDLWFLCRSPTRLRLHENSMSPTIGKSSLESYHSWLLSDARTQVTEQKVDIVLLS
ncbi:unnamed protein product [Soboliphyme baturini]|uniref:Secreted protein n=1 Tax=Soboliphyme baturini TaxID=241478 RepID=A0A183IMI8_9BILA|nr:unnamed protein product [Soboliphyme baturini]